MKWTRVLKIVSLLALAAALIGFAPAATQAAPLAQENLLQNPGIVRNRLKVQSAVINAQKFLDVKEEFGSFDRFIWQFVDGGPVQNKRRSMADIPSSTPESDAMSKELKRRGFKFVGSTICYAHMQATGMVNDHTTDCFRHEELR